MECAWPSGPAETVSLASNYYLLYHRRGCSQPSFIHSTMKLFPFKDGCDAMQRALVGHLNDPNYAFSLPNLASHSWNLILNDRQEMERLEFLGDALIGAFVSEELLRLRPNEGPGFYTVSYKVSNTYHCLGAEI